MDWDHLENSIHPSWQKHLAGEFKKSYWNALKQKLKKEVDSVQQTAHTCKTTTHNKHTM